MTATEVYQAAKAGAKDGFREAFLEAMQSDLTQVSAAEMLGVTSMTISRWIKSGKITATKSGKISKSEVIRLLNDK